jgi:hypothetical protein
MAPNSDIRSTLVVRELSCSSITKNINSKPKRRSVCFEGNDTVLEIPHLSDMDEQQIRDVWWSVEECLSLKVNCRNTVRQMNQLGLAFVENDESCSRGLENFTKARLSIRKARRAAAVRVVLEEQELQFDEGSYDHSYIADVYRDISVLSQREAQSRGFDDQEQSLPVAGRLFPKVVKKRRVSVAMRV